MNRRDFMGAAAGALSLAAVVPDGPETGAKGARIGDEPVFEKKRVNASVKPRKHVFDPDEVERLRVSAPDSWDALEPANAVNFEGER